MELKSKYLDELYREKYFDKDVPLVYLKSEADKVIAEKDTEIGVLKERIVHHKYKRCLAMAEFCQYRSETFFTWSKKMGFLLKWQNRWLELAEKFKEAK